MATLIPAIGSSAFDSTGERRLAERLEQKLDADYLLWHNVPIGPKQTYPDFVVLHPRRGLLVLETKDWHLETVRNATRQYWEILDSIGRPKPVKNPLEQARHCAIQVVNALERDPQLVQTSGPHQGKLALPWGHGVVFIQIMTMKVSKGLEFPVVALPGVGHMPAAGEDEKEAARVFYVAATRATQRLVIGVGGDGGFGRSLSNGTATAAGLSATRAQ